MTTKELEAYCHRRLRKLINKTIQKQREYARNNDAFHAFKRQAQLRKHPPIDMLASDWSKHLVSLMDIANDLETGKIKHLTFDQILEKSGDNIIYSMIFETMAREILRKA